jgi:hypothetical protein
MKSFSGSSVESVRRSHDSTAGLDVGGIRVRVATPETLYRMKRDTVRPIDRIDAEVLKEAFDLKDDD